MIIDYFLYFYVLLTVDIGIKTSNQVAFFKGAIAVCFNLFGTSLLFINSHFACKYPFSELLADGLVAS